MLAACVSPCWPRSELQDRSAAFDSSSPKCPARTVCRTEPQPLISRCFTGVGLQLRPVKQQLRPIAAVLRAIATPSIQQKQPNVDAIHPALAPGPAAVRGRGCSAAAIVHSSNSVMK